MSPDIFVSLIELIRDSNRVDSIVPPLGSKITDQKVSIKIYHIATYVYPVAPVTRMLKDAMLAAE